MSVGIFERHYGISPKTFMSVSEVSNYIEGRTGEKLQVYGQGANGLVQQEGNVFNGGEKTINDMVDNALRDQEWVKILLSKI